MLKQDHTHTPHTPDETTSGESLRHISPELDPELLHAEEADADDEPEETDFASVLHRLRSPLADRDPIPLHHRLGPSLSDRNYQHAEQLRRQTERQTADAIARRESETRREVRQLREELAETRREVRQLLEALRAAQTTTVNTQ